MLNSPGQTINIAGFLGDIHAEDVLLKQSLEFFNEKNITNIFCVGDICDGYGDLDKTVSLMKEGKVLSVLGNHDEWFNKGEMRHIDNCHFCEDQQKDTVDYIKSLPKTLTFTASCGDIILCHGILDNTLGMVSPLDYGYALNSNTSLQDYLKGSYPSIMINGHSHKKMVRKIQNKLIISTGTLYREQNPCISIMDFDSKEAYFYDFVGDQLINEPTVISFRF